MASSPAGSATSTVDFVHCFGPFELDARAGELRRDGIPVKLQPQPLRVLAQLVDRPGELVTREELQKALWGNETYVDFERGLNFCINQVRAALGDSADAPQFIQTLPRRGYRFIAPVGSERRQTPSTERLTEQGRTAATWRIVATGIVFLAILVAGATFIARQATTTIPGTSPARTMLAVLPMEDLTGDPPPPWFADGLTDELITQIGRVSPQRLGVIARTSAMAYRGSSKSVGEIGRELGISHLVEGSLRREGNRLRITVQLVRVADQTRIWSETYDRSAHGALTIQSEIAAQVTRALALELLSAPWATATWTGTHAPDAHDAYLRGKYFRHRGQAGDLRLALAQFEAAVRVDPAFAAACAAQADTWHLLAMSGQTPPADAYVRATASAQRAMRLDPNLADAHTAMGLVELWGNWNPAAAVRSFERAVALNPSDAAAHHGFAWALVALRRFDEAVAHISLARDLDPVSVRASNDVGWLYLQVGQPSEALRACRQTLAIDPSSIEAQQCLERAHQQRGELTEAIAAARAAARLGRGPVPAVLEEAETPERRLRSLWRSRLERLEALANERYVSPYTLAMHHVVLGQDEEALARLEEAHKARVAVMVLLPTDPVFEPLRNHPRFIRLVRDIRREG